MYGDIGWFVDDEQVFVFEDDGEFMCGCCWCFGFVWQLDWGDVDFIVDFQLCVGMCLFFVDVYFVGVDDLVDMCFGYVFEFVQQEVVQVLVG